MRVKAFAPTVRAIMNTTPTPVLREQRGLALLLAALAAVGPFSIDAYLPAMGEIGRTLGAGSLEVQQTLTAYMVPFAAMTLWHGAISDALGRRRVILWGIALFAFASVACALATSIEWLIAFRALQGMTAGAGVVVGRAIVRDRFQGADAQRVMSQITLTFALAPAIAPVLGGWLEVLWGWRSVFAFLVLFAGTCWLVCRSMLSETLPPERRQSFKPRFLLKSYFHVLSSRRFVALSLTGTLNFVGFFFYVAAAPEFLTKHLGVSETGFLWLFGPATIGMAMGSWMSGRIAGTWSPRRTLLMAFGLMGSSVVANVVLHLIRAPGLPWSVAPLVLYVFGMALAFPTLTLLALDLFPAQRGLAASCQAFVQTTGSALATVAAPFVWGSVLSLAITQGIALLLAFGALLLHGWREIPDKTHQALAE